MSNSKTLSDERIAEILAFEDTDISDCPELTDEQLARMKPRHPEYFIREKEPVQINLEAGILAWLKASGEDYETRINELLRQAMFHPFPVGERLFRKVPHEELHERKAPRAGCMKGTFLSMSDDFNAPLEDFNYSVV